MRWAKETCFRLIADPVRPFRLKPGVRYRVVKDSAGRLVVREAKRYEPCPANDRQSGNQTCVF